MSSSSDVAEARALIKSGEKKLKTSILRWKPDRQGAAEHFERAAAIFARAKQRVEACDAWKRGAESYAKAYQDPSAAICYEAMGNFLVSAFSSDLQGDGNGEVSGTLLEAVAAFQQAALLFRAERPSRALDIMHRAVDVVEQVLSRDKLNRPSLKLVPPNPLAEEYFRISRATLGLYKLFADREDIFPHRVPALCRSCVLRHLRSGETGRAIQMEKYLMGCHAVLGAGDLLALGISESSSSPDVYVEEANVFKRLNQPANAARVGLEIIILTLHEDHQRVEMALQEFQRLSKVFGFQNSEEQHAASMLLSAMEDKNDKFIEEVLRDNACFTFMQAQVSQIAFSFISKESAGAGKATQRKAAAPTSGDGPLKQPQLGAGRRGDRGSPAAEQTSVPHAAPPPEAKEYEAARDGAIPEDSAKQVELGAVIAPVQASDHMPTSDQTQGNGEAEDLDLDQIL